MRTTYFLLVMFLLGGIAETFAQAGIAVTPGRVYYRLMPGTENTQRIKVTNPTSGELEVGVSFNDWNYHENGGNNIQEAGSLENSCSNWIQVLPDTYFILAPGETRDVEVVMQVPAEVDTALPVRTSMIFFTQLNPGQGVDQVGAGIQVTVRMGVKIYHSFEQQSVNEMDIVDFKRTTTDDNKTQVGLYVENTGKIWTNGLVDWEVFNNNTGKKTKLSRKEFYTLPQDVRLVSHTLPDDLEKGDYTITAIVTDAERDDVNIAEMDFTVD